MTNTVLTCFDPSWTVVQSFPVLGHVVSDSGGVRQCWKSTKSNLWKAFWGNCRNARLSNDRKNAYALLERSVYPVLNFRASRWPPQKTIAQELDQTQACMIASIARDRPRPGEDMAHCCRRRMRDAHSIARNSGSWSKRWFRRFEKWNEHLDRHPEHPCSKLWKVRDASWLQSRRATFASSNAIRWNSWTCLAGRSDTRVCNGYVAQRWEQGRLFGRESC